MFSAAWGWEWRCLASSAFSPLVPLNTAKRDRTEGLRPREGSLLLPTTSLWFHLEEATRVFLHSHCLPILPAGSGSSVAAVKRATRELELVRPPGLRESGTPVQYERRPEPGPCPLSQETPPRYTISGTQQAFQSRGPRSRRQDPSLLRPSWATGCERARLWRWLLLMAGVGGGSDGQAQVR